MKNKRVLVLGVALVLLALAATVAFAWGQKDGVVYAVIEGQSPRLIGQTTAMYTEVYNENDYAVRVDLSRTYNDDVLHRDVQLAAKQTKHFAGSYYVSRVRR
jgi:flagellar basal body-associated protein FliL